VTVIPQRPPRNTDRAPLSKIPHEIRMERGVENFERDFLLTGILCEYHLIHHP
jgi:hypothetical protein